ncbi:MAG: gas vesicle structural protein GvpA [Jatrophihabitans sp.]|uniref:gas vesicle structural protein GvpA n=1 Tax=Jatrophihabitans sp. TaxID=1932789 RepID=UPI003F81D27F
MTQALANRAPHPSGLADVLDLVLDKGIVIDAYVRLSLVGIEILTLDARVVIASVDTYLRFAEAVNRLDIQPSEQAQGLPGLVGQLQESGASHKTKGALSGMKDSAKEVVSSLRGDDGDSGRSNGSGSNGNGRPRSEARRPSSERRARSDSD